MALTLTSSHKPPKASPSPPGPLWLLLMAALWIPGCGDLSEHPLLTAPTPSKNITYATKHEISQGSVREGEYLVGFKTRPSEQTSFLSWPSLDPMDAVGHIHDLLHTDYVETGWMDTLEVISRVTAHDLAEHFPGPLTPSLGRVPPWMDVFENASHFPHSDMNITVVHFSSERRARSVLTALAVGDKIWYAEPNRISTLSEAASTQTRSPELFKDVTKQYSTSVQQDSTQHVSTIRLQKALDRIANLSPEKLTTVIQSAPVIAVLDSGVDIEHPALKNRIYDLGKEAVFASSRACMKNRTTPSTKGCNTAIDYEGTPLKKGILGDGKFWPWSTDGFGKAIPGGITEDEENAKNAGDHGTHVAGLAMGYDPSKKIFGTCPICWLMPIRITGHGKTSAIRDSAIIRGLQFVSLFNRKETPIVRVVNLSFGKSEYSRSVAMMIKVLKNKGKGTLAVGAAGNEDTATRIYPGSLDDVLSVAAVGDKKGKLKKSLFSNSGYWVDVAAPGEAVWSAISGGTAGGQTGTSQASPLVAGLAGLLFAVAPNATSDQIEGAIVSSAYFNGSKRLYRQNPEYTKKSVDGQLIVSIGKGIVDADNALSRTISGKFESQYLQKRVAGCTLGFHHNTAPDPQSHPPPSSPPSLWLLALMLLLPILLIKIL